MCHSLIQTALPEPQALPFFHAGLRLLIALYYIDAVFYHWLRQVSDRYGLRDLKVAFAAWSQCCAASPQLR